MGCHFLLQGIFLTQGSNLCLLLCRWILYHWVTWEAQRKDYCEPKILIFPLAFPFLICPGNRFGGDVVTFHNLADFPNPQMDQPPQCLNLTVYKMSPHHLLASAMLGTLLVNWKNLLLTAHAVWWPVHTLLSSTTPAGSLPSGLLVEALLAWPLIQHMHVEGLWTLVSASV